MGVLALVCVLVALIFLLFLSFVVSIFMTSKRRPNLERYSSEKYFTDPNNNNEKNPFPSLFDAASVDLSVIVPSYNEEDRLPVMLNEAMEYLIDRQKEKPNFTYEIIIVDDGSKDTTTEVALLYSEKYGTDRVRVLTFVKNRGKGGAVRMGVLSARGKNILFADADGATKFSDLQQLEDTMSKIGNNKGQHGVVCGSRAHLAEEAVAQDTQCGFKLITRESSRLLFTNLHVERWAFDVDMLYIARHLNIPIAEVAVNWQEIEGTKMVPVWSWLQMGRDLILIRLRYMLGAWTIDDKVH